MSACRARCWLGGIFFVRGLFPPVGRWIYNLAGSIVPMSTEQTFDDALPAEVQGHGDTRPGVTYTTIVTECDEVVTPCNKQFRSGPRVTTVVLQDRRSSAAAGDVRSPTTSQGRRSGRRRE